MVFRTSKGANEGMKIYTIPKDLAWDREYRDDLAELYEKHGYILEWVAQLEYILYDTHSKTYIKRLLGVS